MQAEVDKAKNDLQLKAEQMQPSIADGANCAGRLAVAEAKLRVIRTRLAALDAQGVQAALAMARRMADEAQQQQHAHSAGENAEDSGESSSNNNNIVQIRIYNKHQIFQLDSKVQVNGVQINSYKVLITKT